MLNNKNYFNFKCLKFVIKIFFELIINKKIQLYFTPNFKFDKMNHFADKNNNNNTCAVFILHLKNIFCESIKNTNVY